MGSGGSKLQYDHGSSCRKKDCGDVHCSPLFDILWDSLFVPSIFVQPRIR